MKQNLLLLLLFATLSPSFGVVLKKETRVDTIIFYQEGIYEYELNLSENAYFEFGTVYANSDLARVILILHNDSNDTAVVRKMNQVSTNFQWNYQPFEKIAPHDTVELRIEMAKDAFESFENQIEINYRQSKSKSFFSFTTHGNLGKGAAVIASDLPPKIQINRLGKDSLSPIRYNGAFYNQINEQGNKDGKWVYFYPDGTVSGLFNYFNGYEMGESVTYYTNGKIRDYKNYDKHSDLYYLEDGTLFLRAVPDSLIYYYPSGRIEQITLKDRIKYFDENGSPIHVQNKRHETTLQAYEMVLETTYYENGNLRKRRYSNGKTVHYAENERNCISQISEAPFRRPKRELYFNQCELEYIDVYTSISDAYQPKMECVRNERGEFRGDTLMNGRLTFLKINGDTLFARKIVDGQETSDLFFQHEHYNFTDSLGRKQGTWIYNSPHSQTWSDYGFPIIYQKFVYKNDTLQYPFYHYYETGEVKHIYTKGIAYPNQNRVVYSQRGNIIGESIEGIYYGYADSTIRIQTAYNNGSEMEYEFKNGKLVRRSTPKQEDYYSLEEPGWRPIPYSVSEGTFRNYHIYNGTIRFFDKRGILFKTTNVVNGAINGDQILVFKDSWLEQELTAPGGYVDLDHNGYITKSEALHADELHISGAKITDVSDFRYFTNLKILNFNHIFIHPSNFKNSSKLLAEIKKAQAIIYIPSPPVWRDIEIAPEIFLEVKMQEDEIIDFPEQDPSFPGGEDSLKAYITKNLKYPINARDNNIQGVVYIQFVVNVDGSISAIEVMRGVSTEIDNEAIRLISEMPNWIPGKNHGKAVRTRFIYPIRFRLD